MAKGSRWTVVMQVWDVTADLAWLLATEVYGVYRSQAAAEADAAAAKQEAEELTATIDLGGRELDVVYTVAPCFYPDTGMVLDGLRRVYGVAAPHA